MRRPGTGDSQHALAELYQVGFADIKANQAESNRWWQRLEAKRTLRLKQVSVDVTWSAMPADTARARISGKGKTSRMRKPINWPSSGLSERLHKKWNGVELARMEYQAALERQKISLALQHHKKAAELGQVEAMYHLGLAYSNGNGVSKDYASD